MSLYADYIKEREGLCIYEDARGFATYRIAKPECYIIDIYVRPEDRKSYVASEYADKISAIAKSAGCTYLLGSVSPEVKGSTANLKVLLAYGFKLFRSTDKMIYFTKELK